MLSESGSIHFPKRKICVDLRETATPIPAKLLRLARQPYLIDALEFHLTQADVSINSYFDSEKNKFVAKKYFSQSR